MERFNFEELKGEISYELHYPKWALSTRKDAAQKLQVSLYYFDKMRKKYPYYECPSHGSIFFYNSDLRRFLGEEYPYVKSDPDFDELESSIRYVLHYPKDQLLILKTAPRLLGISTHAFNKLRKAHEFCEYEYLGFKFFNKDELTIWKDTHSK